MPRTYYGPTGENNSTYANGGNANLGRKELGTYLILPDQRKYQYALNDGTVEVAGNLYQSVASVAGHVNRGPDVVRAIGATAISATLTSTAAADDIYAEGIVHINNDTGQGYSYRIRRANTVEAANADAVASGVLTVNLQAGETVQVAIDTTTEVTFTRNRFHQVLILLRLPRRGWQESPLAWLRLTASTGARLGGMRQCWQVAQCGRGCQSRQASPRLARWKTASSASRGVGQPPWW